MIDLGNLEKRLNSDQKLRQDFLTDPVATFRREGVHLSFEQEQRRTVHAAGANNYPDDTGRPTGSPKTSKAFDRLSAAVQELLGDSSF